jgi:hypothetical protein
VLVDIPPESPLDRQPGKLLSCLAMEITEELAERIAREVLIRVDGGCSVCMENAAENMQEVLPQFDWKRLVKEAERKRYER